MVVIVALKVTVFLLSIWTITAETVHSKESVLIRKARETYKGLTKIVDHAYCDSSLSDEEKVTKKTLREIHSYAELKFDPQGNLPESFTICSSIMTPSCANKFWPTFFTILDNNMAQFFAPAIRHKEMTSLLIIYYHEERSKFVTGEIPPLFPNRWIKSCLAINTTSRFITWVFEGVLILNTATDELSNSTRPPKDIGKKLVLGARSYGGSWRAYNTKVTGVNIFSSSLSVERMQRMTAEGICFEKGDYLAWEDMEWVLHGQARIGIIDHEVTCKRKSYTNLFYARFQDWETCMRHCKKLGSRVPSVSNFHDWLKLQKSLKEAKVLNTMYFWLPISDRRKEGEWRDFYTGDVIQNYTHPWIRSEPNGGNEQNCADLEENGWADAYCSDPNRACVCTQDPEIHLELKGYMPNTMIDRYYKLTSDYQDR